MRKATHILALLSIVVSAYAQDKAKYGNFEAITADRLKAHLEFIANDLLEGRDTPSRGQDIAAWYVATQLKLWGVKPAGDDGTYFQKIAITRPVVDVENCSFEFGGKSHKFGDGFTSMAVGGKVQGPLVFVGDGAQSATLGLDPYKSVDVKGRVVIRTMNQPKGFSFRDVQSGKLKDYKSAYQAAAEHGAVAVIQIIDSTDADRWTSMVARASQPGFPQVGGGRGPQSTIPVITVTQDMAKELLQGEAANLDDILKNASNQDPNASFALKADKKVSIDIAASENASYTQNVVGIIPGSDPKLKDEYVALGAHIDHLGKRDNVQGDGIYNGADDDGSGTVSILEIAHAMATGPHPKRSILIVWHTGEEKGLWGSSYFTTHPTVPITSIITQLNIDMIGRSRPAGDTKPANKMLTDANTIYVVGSRRLSTDLGNIVDTVDADMYKVKYDYHYDAPNDPENIYQRSDHYNYASKGIPIAFWFDGVHEDYHRVSDEVSKIDFAKMQKIVRTVYATAYLLAGNASRPKVNQKGS